MGALESIRGRIADFPGYDDDSARRRSDEMVRSYLGEALARLETRLEISDGSLAGDVGDALIRAGFVDQASYRAYAERTRDGGPLAAVADADAATVELADRAGDVRLDGVADFLTQVRGILDQRNAAMGGRPVRIA